MDAAESAEEEEAGPGRPLLAVPQHQRFCSRAGRCEQCGRPLGAVFGLEGFGLWEQRHRRRCPAVSSHAEPLQVASAVTAQGIISKTCREAAGSESLAWLNALLSKLWPNIDAAVQNIVRAEVLPQVNESLPGILRGRLKVSKFTLGSTPPEVGPISYHELIGGAKLKVEINFDSSVDIALDLGASAGVRSLKFSGTLVIRLGPLINGVPVVGGIVVYFLGRPSLELDFTGLGNIADVPGLAGIVRRTIDDILAGALVLPNMISVPLASEEQGVDRALLKRPMPLGVMRVSVVQAWNLLGKDVRVLRASTSDPYVKVKLSEDEWHSSTVQATCNPLWGDDDYHDFFVFDRDQQFAFEVYDADRFSSDDLLGVSRPVSVLEAVGRDEVVLPLFPCQDACKPGEASGSGACGALKLRFGWLQLAPRSIGTEGSVVAIRVKHMRLPRSVATELYIAAECSGIERSTPLIKAQQPRSSTSNAGERTAYDIVRRCHEQGIDRAAIARIADLDIARVDRLLGAGGPASSAEAEPEASELVLAESMIYIPLVRLPFDAGKPLTLAALDKQGRPLGTSSFVVHKAAHGHEPSSVHLKRPDGSASGVEVSVSASLHGLHRGDASPQEFHIGSTEEQSCSEGGSPWR